ncbi:hypothetical protein J4464_05595 [Candidatus Woesearchaeota archaeon]|nr:hypothetical protein [Candidatus Woesearchaeota archaeon]
MTLSECIRDPKVRSAETLMKALHAPGPVQQLFLDHAFLQEVHVQEAMAEFVNGFVARWNGLSNGALEDVFAYLTNMHRFYVQPNGVVDTKASASNPQVHRTMSAEHGVEYLQTLTAKLNEFEALLAYNRRACPDYRERLDHGRVIEFAKEAFMDSFNVARDSYREY